MRTRETLRQKFMRQIAEVRTANPISELDRAELDLLYRDGDRNYEHLAAAIWAAEAYRNGAAE